MFIIVAIIKKNSMQNKQMSVFLSIFAANSRDKIVITLILTLKNIAL